MSNFVGVSTPYGCSSVLRSVPLGALVCKAKIYKAVESKLEVRKLIKRADPALGVPTAKAPPSEQARLSISICLSLLASLPPCVGVLCPPALTTKLSLLASFLLPHI